MTTNDIRKIVTLLAVLIIGATMSGCIDSVVSDINIDTITIPVNAPTYITESADPTVKTVVNVTNESVIKPIQKLVSITATQKSDSLIVTVQGGKDLHQLKELRVIVNNETIDVYSPDCQVPRTIGCTIIGDWKVICEATFEDGTTQTVLSTRFNGLPNTKTDIDTGIVPERYVEPSTTSREEAKRICEENGVIWDCDDPVVTPTANPTPNPTPVVTPSPTQKANGLYDYKVNACITISKWNENTVYLREIRSSGSPGSEIAEKFSIPKEKRIEDGPHSENYIYLQYIKIYMDDQLIAEFKPTVVKGNIHYYVEELPMIIKISDDIDSSSEITVIGTFDYLEIAPHGGYLSEPDADGDHPLNVNKNIGWPIGTTQEEAESAEEWTRYN